MEGLELEEVDKVLWGDGHEAAVGVVGCAWMAPVLEHSQQPYCQKEGGSDLEHWSCSQRLLVGSDLV